MTSQAATGGDKGQESLSDSIALSSRHKPFCFKRSYGSTENISPLPHDDTEPEAAHVPMGNDEQDSAPVLAANPTKLPPLWSRMPNTAFGIAMGLAGNAIMWKSAGGSDFIGDRINTTTPNFFFWILGIAVGNFVGIAYLFKLIFRFPLVRDEYRCKIRIHFMNAPHLTLIMLAMGVPAEVGTTKATLRIFWAVGFVFQTLITQLIYEKFMFSEQSNISVARPQFLLSTVGWFLLAVLGQQADVEPAWGLALPSFCFGAGTMFYVMVVIAVFNELHRARKLKGSPALSLLFAPPAVAVVAIDMFDGDTDEFSVVAEMILGWCLVLVLLLFKLGPMIAMQPPALGAYWAYVFPLSALAGATIRYAAYAERSSAELMAVVFILIAIVALVAVFARMTLHTYMCFRGETQWGDPLLDMEGSKTSLGRESDETDYPETC